MINLGPCGPSHSENPVSLIHWRSRGQQCRTQWPRDALFFPPWAKPFLLLHLKGGRKLFFQTKDLNWDHWIQIPEFSLLHHGTHKRNNRWKIIRAVDGHICPSLSLPLTQDISFAPQEVREIQSKSPSLHQKQHILPPFTKISFLNMKFPHTMVLFFFPWLLHVPIAQGGRDSLGKTWDFLGPWHIASVTLHCLYLPVKVSAMGQDLVFLHMHTYVKVYLLCCDFLMTSAYLLN
jgi:hypothetical protein